MKVFETFEQVDDMQPCLKIAVTHAKKLDHEFRVKSLEGNYKQGKAGDYLMRGPEGELYICDGPIFDQTYAFIHRMETSWSDRFLNAVKKLFL